MSIAKLHAASVPRRMWEEVNSCVVSAAVIYLNIWVTTGRPLTKGHWNQADRGNLICGLMGALRARTSFHGKRPMTGLTGTLVQLCTVEGLAYMTLWSECNALKASAAIPFWRDLQPGVSSFQIKAGISDPSLQKHHSHPIVMAGKQQSCHAEDMNLISYTAFLRAVGIIPYPNTIIRLILFCTETGHIDLCLRFSLSRILSFVYRSK